MELLKISASPTDSSASPLALHCSYGPSPPPGAPSSSSSPALHSLKQYLAGVGSTPRWAKTPVRWSKNLWPKHLLPLKVEVRKKEGEGMVALERIKFIIEVRTEEA